MTSILIAPSKDAEIAAWICAMSSDAVEMNSPNQGRSTIWLRRSASFALIVLAEAK